MESEIAIKDLAGNSQDSIESDMLTKETSQSPKLSIIIPIYNMGKYLRECLNSVINQSLKELEIICVDDGSTDNTSEILKEYQWKDNRIKVLAQTNHGVSYSRNRGIEYSSGEYIFFIDPDDWLPDTAVLEDLYTTAIEKQAFVCGGSFREISEQWGTIDSWTGSNSKYTFQKDGFVDYKDYQYDYGWVRFIYNRKFLIQNHLYLPLRKYYEDPVFFVQVMSKAKRFYGMRRTTYCYRTGHHSYDLSYEKALHLLQGMNDIVTIARENHYDVLKSTEEYKLTHDYAFNVARYLKDDYAVELRKEINKLNSLLDRDNRRIEITLLKNYYAAEQEKKQGEIQDKNKEIAVLNNKIAEQNKEIEEQSKKIANLNKEIIELKHEINSIKSELDRTYHSYNWNVGRLILFIPKKIASFFGISRRS